MAGAVLKCAAMFKPLEVWVGLRYLRAKRRNHFISFISLSSMLGIAVGVAALITVLSVMNGFEKELRERILGMASHATITGLDGTLADWPTLRSTAAAQPYVVGVAPYVQGEGMLTRGDAVHGALIRGVLPAEEIKVSKIGDYMTAGSIDSLTPGSFNILIGGTLSRQLGARIGDKVTLVVPQFRTTVAGMLPRLKRFTVSGVFDVNHAQFDTSFAMVNMDDAALVLQLRDEVTGLRVEFDDLYRARVESRNIARALGGTYWVTDWTQLYSNFFRALRTEKTVMFVILTLIVAVAAFNIVSTLVMLVTDKQPDIAILRTLGAKPRNIMGIFMVQGSLLGVFGVLLGAVGGVALAVNVPTLVPAIESLFDTKFLAPDIYYISDVPSDMRWPDVISITAVALVMSVLATLYPAWRASRTLPADALRYD